MEIPSSLKEMPLGLIDVEEDGSIIITTPFQFQYRDDYDDCIEIMIDVAANKENYVISDNGSVEKYLDWLVEFHKVDPEKFSLDGMQKEVFFEILDKQYDLCLDNVTEDNQHRMISIICPISDGNLVASKVAVLLQIITILTWV